MKGTYYTDALEDFINSYIKRGYEAHVEWNEFKAYSIEEQREKIVLQKSLEIDIKAFEVTSSIVFSKNGNIVSKPFHAKRVLNKGISWIIEKYNSKEN